MNSTNYAAVAGEYYGWSTAYNYLDAYQMQLDTNVLVNGSCLSMNDTYDMVVCPSNTYKLAAGEISGLCAERGLSCPIVSALPALLYCECPVMSAFFCCKCHLAVKDRAYPTLQVIHCQRSVLLHVPNPCLGTCLVKSDDCGSH